VKEMREADERLRQAKLPLIDGFEKEKRIIAHVLETPQELAKRIETEKAKYIREIEEEEASAAERNKGQCVIM
jgi:hypothetical protein